MQSQLLTENPVPLAVARRSHIPKNNDKEVSPSTVLRWIHKGIKAGDGSIVKLEAIKIGKSLMTTQAAVNRFFTRLTERSRFFDSHQHGEETELAASRPLSDLRKRNLLD